MVKHLVMVLMLAACSGSPPPPSADAAATNLPFGATCAVTSDTSTECASGVCTNSFDMLGHDVCSIKCTVGDSSTCPSGTQGMKCNGKGYCAP
jgi:hypothetical protein